MIPKLLMLVDDYAEDYETMIPFQTFWAIGYQVDAVSPHKKAGETIQTIIQDAENNHFSGKQMGHVFTLNADFQLIDTNDYLALIVPGGLAPESLRLNQRVLQMVQEFDQAKKPIAALCQGVQVLAAANVIKDKYIATNTACSWDIHVMGGQYRPVPMNNAMADSHLITAPSWLAQPAWMAQLLYALGTRIQLSA